MTEFKRPKNISKLNNDFRWSSTPVLSTDKTLNSKLCTDTPFQSLFWRNNSPLSLPQLALVEAGRFTLYRSEDPERLTSVSTDSSAPSSPSAFAFPS
jgi:hypothetical protein